jgi:hypothetical protein
LNSHKTLHNGGAVAENQAPAEEKQFETKTSRAVAPGSLGSASLLKNHQQLSRVYFNFYVLQTARFSELWVLAAWSLKRGSVLDNGYFWPGFIKRYGRWFRWRRVPSSKRAAVHDVVDRAGIIESQAAALDGRAKRGSVLDNGYFWPGFIKRYRRWFRWRRVPTPQARRGS